MTRQTDLHFAHYGSIFVVTPFTQAAKEWLGMHVDLEEAQYWAGGVVVEPRYVEDILVGAEDAGLRVA